MTVDDAAGEGLALYVFSGSNKAELVLYHPDKILAMLKAFKGRHDVDLDEDVKALFARAVAGQVTLSRKHKGKCWGAWEVVSSSAEKGYGPMLYDVAMAVAPSKTLVSDRSSVSPSAKGVWSYYFHNRGDVEKLPLDDIDDPKTPTPEDDCEVSEPEIRRGRDANPLNYAYRTEASPAGRTLNRRHEEFADAAQPLLKAMGFTDKAVEMMLMTASTRYFSGKYMAQKKARMAQGEEP